MATQIPQFHDIVVLPALAYLIDQEIENAKSQLQSIEECHAYPVPMLDNATLEQTITMFSEGHEYLDFYEEQLRHWAALTTLTADQKTEVARLQGIMRPLRTTIAAVA